MVFLVNRYTCDSLMVVVPVSVFFFCGGVLKGLCSDVLLCKHGRQRLGSNTLSKNSDEFKGF